MPSHTNRRVFIRNAALATSGLLIARFAHGQDILSEDNPTAVAMGYSADHTEVDTSVWTKKAGPDGSNQQCTTCALYNAVDDNYGLCPIFAGKRVHAVGWCNGWVPK